MRIATGPKALITIGTAAGLAVALASLTRSHRLDMLVEAADRIATVAIVCLVAWLATSTRALTRQNADLAAKQADLREQVTGYANRSHVQGQEFVRQVGYLHADRREDDQHRIAVLTAIKGLGPRIEGRLVAVGEEQYAGGYSDALDQRPPSPPTQLRVVR